ncbi:MAG: flagellar protein FlgN [Clostridium sp.]|nr:flagellar protein FlgN [Acetatifactor muris]MCM1526399.1 flagellar protein FlgN [Bacteroides sp.]MCM1563238.1 flagellar protein FlgN [Clostridium sp.]
MENQLNILSESLDRKVWVLREIQEYNDRQEQAFKSEQADLDSFDAAIEEKERLIQELTKLDEGFEALYDRVAGELKDNRGKYAPKIRELQDKVAEVMDLSVAIQAQEARNKKLVEDYFAKARTDLHRNRQTSKAAYDYYKNMSGTGYASSQFMDSKQ